MWTTMKKAKRMVLITVLSTIVFLLIRLAGNRTVWWSAYNSWKSGKCGPDIRRPHPAKPAIKPLHHGFTWSSNLPPFQKFKQVFDTRGFDIGRGYSYLSLMAKKGKIDFDVVGGYDLPTRWFSHLDFDILKDPPLRNVKSVATALMSSLHVHQTNNKTPAVGDHFTVRLDLRDIQGHLVHCGGHEVRVWMLSTSGSFSWADSKAAAADVTDLGNGSYIASLPVLWPGRTHVVAALMRPREFRGLMLRLLNKMKSLFQITAAFVRGGFEQVTYCFPIPVIPGFPEVCNMTSLNNGLPWYCGKPSNPSLTCSDWIKTRSTEFPSNFPLSKTENDLFQAYFTRKNMIFRLSEKHVFDAENGNLSVSATPCAVRRPRDTWNDQSPRGFWNRGVWIPLKCSLPKLTSPWIDNCLRDTTVFLLGDSNLRKILYMLNDSWKCQLKKARPDSDFDTIYCGKASHRANVTWYPHSYPFFVRATWTWRFSKHSPRFYMDAIPSTGRTVVLLHLYAHFLVHHSYIVGLHVRDAAQGVRDLLSRNPSARVLVQGPHALAGAEKMIIGDHHAERSRRILRQEFRDLMDRVTFLDTWDMTVASENKDVHPHPRTVWEITRMFLGHVCPP